MSRNCTCGLVVVLGTLAAAVWCPPVDAAKPPSGGGGPPPVNVRYTYVPLGTLGGAYSYANGMNDHGDVVGYSQASDGSAAFICEAGGSMVDLNSVVDPSLMVRLVQAHDINDAGQIVGYGYHHDGNENYFDRFQFRLTPDVDEDGFDELEDIGGWVGGRINNDGDIAGADIVNGGWRPLIYSDDFGLCFLPGGPDGFPSAINDRVNGQLQIVGDGFNRGWRYTGSPDGSGSIQELAPLWSSPSTSSVTSANDINNSGVVAGWTTTGRDDSRAALYTNSWTSIGSLTTSKNYNDSAAAANNDAGHVVGGSGTGVAGQERAFLYVSGFKMTQLESLIDNLPGSLVGRLGLEEIADPAPGMQFGVICGTASEQAYVLVPDR